ncbi:reverse transcriptase family protein [Marinobacter salexigens]|uniref:reverse transcriptase family protein n=1 Tax=Marinobacter salexigens TaxID=1925763 RepID=UPI0019604CE9|nr:reverse transcriptase family protein [Marinobacter salexigens]
MIDPRFPLFPEKTSKQAISSLESLAEALSVTVKDLEEVRSLESDKCYRLKEIPKNGGGLRKVYDPHPLIRRLQSRINKRIFLDLIQWPGYLFGSLPNINIDGQLVSRDYIACAQKHCKAKSLLKVDVNNFFDNIHRDHVFDIFRMFLKFSDEVSNCLADICCYNGFLVQGALTSSYIATLCFWQNEGYVVKRLSRKGLIYTRLVDDITVSSKRHDFNFEYAEHHIKMMLVDLDLPANKRKREILRDGIEPLQVHGLRVNYASPRLPADEVRRIRAAVKNVVRMSKINNYRTSLSYRAMHDRCMGRVNKLARVGHNKHGDFKRELVDVIPLPSVRDLEKAESSISFLEKLDPERLKLRKYTRRYHLAKYRVSIVARTYCQEADDLSFRLQKLSVFVGDYEL